MNELRNICEEHAGCADRLYSEKTINILAIGNSFSQDATYYLHQIAKADGTEMKIVNLHIGGCSLERHWANVQSGAEEYLYEINGKSTGRHVSVGEALREENWDYIVTQQSSPDSGWPDTYEPFLGNLICYIREQVPGAEILLQETWAYETDSTHAKFPRYHNSQREMFERLRKAYHDAANRYGLKLIPSGEIIQELRKTPPFVYERGGISLCRDGFHMNYIYGRYTLAVIWYKALTGNDVSGNTYMPETSLAPGEKADPAALRVIRDVIENYRF